MDVAESQTLPSSAFTEQGAHLLCNPSLPLTPPLPQEAAFFACPVLGGMVQGTVGKGSGYPLPLTTCDEACFFFSKQRGLAEASRRT